MEYVIITKEVIFPNGLELKIGIESHLCNFQDRIEHSDQPPQVKGKKIENDVKVETS